MSDSEQPKNSKSPERQELEMWAIIYVLSVIVPCFLLGVFWLRYKPPFSIFFVLSLVYLTITLLLLLPLIRGKSKDQQ